MMEQLTAHVYRAENGVFWRITGNTHETGTDIDRLIQQELADALREERKRSARYRAALLIYADEQNWEGDDQLYPQDGPQVCFLTEGDGSDPARKALRQADGEEAGNATKTSE